MKPEALYDTVRAILMKDWDPIEINDVPAAHDEYDGYVQRLVGLLRRGASASVLSERLLHIETVEMGLRGDRGRALRVAEQLTALQSRS